MLALVPRYDNKPGLADSLYHDTDADDRSSVTKLDQHVIVVAT